MTNIFSQSWPKVIYRSKLFSLSTATLFACNVSYSTAYTWTLNILAGSTTRLVDLSANPTAQSSEIVMQANTLAYGLYQFRFRVDVTLSTSLVLSNTIETYIQIVPTGLNVFAIQNGIQSQLIGYNQEFILNPVEYTVDLDNLISPSSLTFQFYCRTTQLNANTQTSNRISLQMYKNNPALPLKWNETCFDSNCKMMTCHFICILAFICF